MSRSSSPSHNVFHETPLARSLAIQGRVVRALLLREVITRFGRHNLGVLWIFFEPMIFTLGIMALWSIVHLHSASIPITAFAITGYSSVLLWRNCANRSAMAIQQNVHLLFHRNVQVLDVMVTRILIEVAGASASFTILSVLFVTLGLMSPPIDLLRVLFGWIMLAWFGAALALVIGAGTAYNEIVERLWHPAAYLLFPLSGAAFMVDWLPAAFQKTMLLLPMVHGVEMLREGYFGNAVRTHYDAGYMAIVCLLLTGLGLILVRQAGLRVESR